MSTPEVPAAVETVVPSVSAKKNESENSKPKTQFSFCVLSLGDFNQLLRDEQTMLNRPAVEQEGYRRGGQEYIIYPQAFEKDLVHGCFLGHFGLDKKQKKNLRLSRNVHAPLHRPDYYIITLNSTGERVNKADIEKFSDESHSQIFSTVSVELPDNPGVFQCQSVCVLQHGDVLVLNGKRWVFDSEKCEVVVESKEK